ncbi:hypothetical protein CD944_09985 [Brevundimonas diminuta]|nr:hypothetical protein CD944_09985 [Brevundimonas diminuta]
MQSLLQCVFARIDGFCDGDDQRVLFGSDECRVCGQGERHATCSRTILVAKKKNILLDRHDAPQKLLASVIKADVYEERTRIT